MLNFKHIIFIIIAGLCFKANASSSNLMFYVSPGGDDKNPGTIEMPFKTISMAKKMVREVNQDMQSDIYVYLRGGTYEITETLDFIEKDSGSNGYAVIYKAYNNETPLLSGGIKVNGWKKHKKNIYKAKLNRTKKLRALYVNGKRAYMAQAKSKMKAYGGWGEFVIKGDEPWAYNTGKEVAGIKFQHDGLKNIKRPKDIEIIQDNIWTEKILCVDELITEEDFTIAKIQQPLGSFATTMQWAPMNLEGEFTIRNAYEFLDEPNEFYFDSKSQWLYYCTDNHLINDSEVVVPFTDILLSIKGSSVKSRIKNLKFEGISFAHTDWGLQEIDGSHGLVGVQSLGLTCQYIEDGNWHPGEYDSCELPIGAIEIKNAENIYFERNKFEHLGTPIAINMANDVSYSHIKGNYFNDLMGTTISIGHPQHYKIGDGSIYPEGIEGVCKDIIVANNYIRNVCLDYRQVEALVGYFAQNITITHNDIEGTPYGGIALGWWWGNSGIKPSNVSRNNTISYNKVGNTHSALHDGGIVYVLGKQPNSSIHNNYLYNGPRVVYPDDGSAYWKVENNVLENVGSNGEFKWTHVWTKDCHDIWFKNNFIRKDSTYIRGTNIVIEDLHIVPENTDWPEEAKRIILESGLEEEYKDIISTNK